MDKKIGCTCCGALRPRYKKLVDHIFPVNAEDGLVKSNMEKLVWYAMHSPDKLDGIGEYLAQRLYRDVNRRRTVICSTVVSLLGMTEASDMTPVWCNKAGYVIIAMDALDQLLVACHANNLNIFVESFLQMIQRLLESQEPMLQLRATESFEKYANIQEDTPQYHRRYDFFVSKFASMCFFTDNDDTNISKLRTAGIMGLQGVIRKADFDDLGDIWQPVHMDKIVPALLFNMEDKVKVIQEPDASDHEGPTGKRPYELAEVCLQELVCRATSGKISNIIKPLLFHLDLHDLWINSVFAVQSFKVLMYAIQVQNSVLVIKMLIAHLNERSNASVRCRIGIADVLSQVIPIAAGECIGPSVIDIINSLLEQIRSSVVEENKAKEASQERLYQETLIHALGEYTNHLPDYQKIECMLFILNKVPGSNRVEDLENPRPEPEIKLQHILLKSLLKVEELFSKVGTNYNTAHYTTAFSQTFFVRLMRMSVSSDPAVRLTVQQILHTLIDRHENAVKLLQARPILDIASLNLKSGKIGRQDINFWKKSGNEILLSIQENCEFPNNTPENIEFLLTTLILLLTEIALDDVVLDILRVSFHIQAVALERRESLSSTARIHLHALVAAIMAAVSDYIPIIKEHIKEVIDRRSKDASHLLPNFLPFYGSPPPVIDDLPPQFLFDTHLIFSILKDSNFDERRLVTTVMRRQSIFPQQNVSLTSLTFEVESIGSSPGIPRRSFGEKVTFESLKKTLCDNKTDRLKVEAERRKQFLEALRTEPLEILVAKAQERDTLQATLNEIFSRLPPMQQNLSLSPPLTMPPSLQRFHPTLNLVSANAPFQLPYPDIIIY